MGVMKVKIDFSLCRRFGVVEQTIFRLILNGLTNPQQIGAFLWVFSDEVIANSLRKLVNQQIIRVDIESRKLSLSDAVVALIEICMHSSFEIDIPNEILLVTDNSDYSIEKTAIEARTAILVELLPNVKRSFLIGLAKCFDFRICKGGEIYD